MGCAFHSLSVSVLAPLYQFLLFRCFVRPRPVLSYVFPRALLSAFGGRDVRGQNGRLCVYDYARRVSAVDRGAHRGHSLFGFVADVHARLCLEQTQSVDAAPIHWTHDLYGAVAALGVAGSESVIGPRCDGGFVGHRRGPLLLFREMDLPRNYAAEFGASHSHSALAAISVSGKGWL